MLRLYWKIIEKDYEIKTHVSHQIYGNNAIDKEVKNHSESKITMDKNITWGDNGLKNTKMNYTKIMFTSSRISK